jgi:hypothetical protein
MKNRIVHFLGLCLVLASCSKDSGTNPPPGASLEEFIQNSGRIAVRSESIVESAIERAFAADGSLDPKAIADSMATIQGVASAAPTETGSGIVVKKKDGYTMNIVLDRTDDDRLFKAAGGAGDPGHSARSLLLLQKPDGSASVREYPENNKAVILAPFQRYFEKDLDLLAGLLRSAGYSVSVFKNEQAGLSRFRSDSLAKYGVVIIDTHGMAGGSTLDDRVSTLLLTGEPVSLQSLNSISAEEMNALGDGVVKGTDYWAISIQWLAKTLHGRFPKSWFFAEACESSRVRSGRTSLVEFLISNGAGGFNGFDGPISIPLAREISWKLTDGLTSGQSLEDVSEALHGDADLNLYAFYLRNIKQVTASNVELLSNVQRITEPFTLFPVQADFPYSGCHFKFSSRASFDDTNIGPYNFAYNCDREVNGTFSDGLFRGTYFYKDDYQEDGHTIEITLDLAKHQITSFKVTGHSYTNLRTIYSVESSGVPLEGNVTNGFFYSTGTDVARYVGTVNFESTWIEEVTGNPGANRLTKVNYDADSRLEIQFY